ncbi:MAG TPA: STAS/SEC14 domain-containing protein [Fodinibius sp.]|nr:STAS/SEC14 domain-containing protein [Fodinibius sp.]
MIIVNNDFENGILALNVKGKLTKDALNDFVPILKKHIEETGDPHLMMILEDFQGWEDAATFWKDINLDAEYVGCFDRIAIVGEKKWQQWSTRLMDPLFNEEIKYFSIGNADNAWNWIEKYH